MTAVQERQVVLEGRGLTAGYLSEPVFADIDLDLGAGEVVGLLGPNGVGKSTLLKAIAGLVPLRRGTATLRGESLGSLPPEERARAGLALVPESRRLFRDLTAEENLRCGAFTGRDGMTMDDVLNRFPALRGRLDTAAKSLSGGEQQMLAIARALRGGPAVLLIDEPSLGLAPLVTKEVFTAVRELGATGSAVLVAEQNLEMAIQIADRCLVLGNGTIVYEGATIDDAGRAAVRRAYAKVAQLEHA